MKIFYFAFGSNMASTRLQERIPRATSCGRGALEDWAFVCNKSGRDGSAKANIVPRADSEVWGVIYELPESELARLDAIEGGYVRIEVEVTGADGEQVQCQTYASTRTTPVPRPFAWYRAVMLQGAREHGLPDEHVAQIEALVARRDEG